MTLIEEARKLAKEFSDLEQANKIENERTIREWEVAHALEMFDSMKSELKDHVLTASRKGSHETFLLIYSWSPHGRPNWVNDFLPSFDDYLVGEGFTFIKFSDYEHDPSELGPKNNKGGYHIKW